MGVVKYFSSLSEAEILALQDTDEKWFDQAFYYPNDIAVKTYYYRIVYGNMIRYADGSVSSVGVKLNGLSFAGIKTLIEENDVLEIPENYDYNTYKLNIDGIINVEGQININ